MDDKHCPKCGKVKAPTQFYRNRSKPTGLDPLCKHCADICHNAWVQANRQKWNLYQAAYKRARNAAAKARREASE